MSSAASQIAAPPAAQPDLPDELLEDIFLRLDAAADVARASAACTTFRRVVSAHRFRRRFRSLHPPPVLGLLQSDRPGAFYPAVPPHRSAPAARALAQAADFSFSFLPNATPNCWNVGDARDGRVLLYRRASETAAFADLVVCDPLHRRYIQLPPIPDDLAAAAGRRGFQKFDPFLDPATDREKEEHDLSFRVICAVQCRRKLVTFHFSSVTGKWRGFTVNRSVPPRLSVVAHFQLFQRHCAHGCFCWTFSSSGSLFILDTRAMKFSVDDHLPNASGHYQQAIVEVGGGRLGLFHVCGPSLDLFSKTLGNNGDDTEEWQHDRMICLPQIDCFFCCWSILGAADGYLLLQAKHFPYDATQVSHYYYTLDLKTLLVERLCVSNPHLSRAHLYASFPPSLSLPSI